MRGVDYGYSIDFYGKIVFLFVILLFCPDNKPVFAAAVEMIENLHDMAVAAILPV